MTNEIDKIFQDSLRREINEVKYLKERNYEDWYLDFLNHFHIHCKCPRCETLNKEWR